MVKKTLHLLIASLIVGASSYAAQERVIRFQNHVRLGYDDNIYSTKGGDGSMFVSDIINLTGKLTFSPRTDALLYWQPEFHYRPDVDESELVSYQNFYAKLSHAVNERVFLTISDRVRYQPKSGQTEQSTSRRDQEFIDNNIMGALEYTLSTLDSINVGGGYEVRVWNDDAYGEGLGNNFNQITANGSWIRQVRPDTTTGILGLNYVNHEYDGPRGGYDSATLYGGVDHIFSPDLTGYGRFGFSQTSSDSATGSSDSTAPYLDAGLTINPKGRTSIDLIGSLGFSSYRSENSLFNIQNRFNFATSVRHDITAKITFAASLSYIIGFYESKFATASGVGLGDAEDEYLSISARCSYQINRNNFVEAGYLFENRTSDALPEWDRNRVDVAWRLRL